MKFILIADDSAAIRDALRELLEGEADWRVCGEAENGREAIQQAEQLHPDLIVLDLSMPVMNGLEAGRQLKILLPTVPLVMPVPMRCCSSPWRWMRCSARPHPILASSNSRTSRRRVVEKNTEGVPVLIDRIQKLLRAA